MAKKIGGHKTPQTPKTGFPGFEQRVKAILWRRIVGPEKERPDYDKWKSSIDEWFIKKGVGRRQAVVNASLPFDCLVATIADYDLSQYGVQSVKKSAKSVAIPSLSKKQSYRENLRWAIDAAGKSKRSREEPEECPNDAAYYLYKQAMDDPKDFLAKVGQIEAKSSAKEELDEDDRKQATKSIDEIDEMLAALEEDEENND